MGHIGKYVSLSIDGSENKSPHSIQIFLIASTFLSKDLFQDINVPVTCNLIYEYTDRHIRVFAVNFFPAFAEDIPCLIVWAIISLPGHLSSLNVAKVMTLKATLRWRQFTLVTKKYKQQSVINCYFNLSNCRLKRTLSPRPLLCSNGSPETSLMFIISISNCHSYVQTLTNKWP